jgi:hypothetical protein
MIKNYFKVAIRNFKRNKAYTFINISGLAIGIASCLLLFLIIRYELSYDKFQPHYKNIYRIATQFKTEEGIEYNPGAPYPALDAFRADLPVTNIAALFATYGTQVSVQNDNAAATKFIEASGVFFTEPEFFDIFSYKWISGHPSVLKEPIWLFLQEV